MALVSSSLPQSTTIFSAAKLTLSRQRAILAASLCVMTTRLMGSMDGDDIANSLVVRAGAHRRLPRGQDLLGLNVQHRAFPFVYADHAFDHSSAAARRVHVWLGPAEDGDHGTAHRRRQMRRTGIQRHHAGGASGEAEQP